jgi:hypothetical protein
MLLVLDNLDALPKEISKRFEQRLIEIARRISGARFLTSSSTSKTKFQQFTSDGPWKMSSFKLNPLDDIQAAELVLTSCARPITRMVLDLENNNTLSI